MVIKSAASQSEEPYSTMSMVYTLIINIGLFGFFILFFEINRLYKQIFLKRLQQRFIDSERVPPEPPEYMFGWLVSIWKVPEIDVLHMVGLDAYMLLRYHVLCIKLCVFLSVVGLATLVPLYSSVPSTEKHSWYTYTITNLATTPDAYRHRLWLPAWLGYIYAAYFCQLMYTEYDHFSKLRLSYLTKADDSTDPDILPQKDYTVIIENIPPELKSAEKLFAYFEELFPGEVFTAEIALDLRELNSVINKAKSVRNRLEKSIALYIATTNRPEILVKARAASPWLGTVKGKWREIVEEGEATPGSELGGYGEGEGEGERGADDHLFEEASDLWWTSIEWLEKHLAPNAFGFETVDAIDYYVAELKALNSKTKLLQEKHMRNYNTLDQRVQRRMKNRHDTRAAVAIEKIGAKGTQMVHRLKQEGGLESFLFGEDKSRSVRHRGYPETPSSVRSVASASSSKSLYEEVEVDSPAPKLGLKSLRWASHISNSEVDCNNSYPFAHQSNTTADSTCTSESTPSTTVSVEDIPSIETTRALSGADAVVSPAAISPMHLTAETEEAVPDEEARELPASSVLRPTDHNIAPLFVDRQHADDCRRHEHADVDLYDPTFENPTLSLAAETRIAAHKLKNAGKGMWEHAKVAGIGAWRGAMEGERAVEVILLGAYYKYSSTAFVTFKSRVAETISKQMKLDHNSMEIHHAPNPNDIIWENVAIPRSQVAMRNHITNIGLIVGSFFWSGLVNFVNSIANSFQMPANQESFLSVCILLMFMLMMPFIFDLLARNYECMKTESEVQNSIMTRYFYYQLVNIYVTVALKNLNISQQLFDMIRNPRTFLIIFGDTIPAVSLYFCNLMIVKIFAAVPIEMLRPWQLTTILSISYGMDRKKCTRRELRSGAFYSWPMLYGWIYPQLMMVEMLMLTYSVISPLLMPFGALFFVVAYAMYKYQLLYVYINEYQSGGFMFYAVFNRSMIGLVFASFVFLAYFSIDLSQSYHYGPFLFLLPLPGAILYFWHYCDALFRKKMDLSYRLAKQRDAHSQGLAKLGRPTPQDSFKEHFYRQPSLTEHPVYPEAYRKVGGSGFLSKNPAQTAPSLFSARSRSNSVDSVDAETGQTAPRVRFEDEEEQFKYAPGVRPHHTSVVNINAVPDELEDDIADLERYYHEVVLPLTKPRTRSRGSSVGAYVNTATSGQTGSQHQLQHPDKV